MKTLQLLIVFSIFILTKQFEVKTRDVENFGLDVGGGLPLRGVTDLSSYGQFLISREISRLDQHPRSSQDDCGNFSAWVIRNKQSSLSFSSHIDDDLSEEGLQTSAETRQTCRQNLTSDNDKLNNREFKSNDSPINSRSPQRPDDPVQLQILMLEDDEVVRTSAASLYAKHPAVSSVHVVDPQQRVHQVKGQPVVLSEHSSLVLVGHGARDRSGEMRISGYTSKDVARIIQNSSRISQKIQTTTVVACEAGSDQRFREALLKELHEAGIETELHLWTAVVQVTESGEVISQDVSADGAQWRSGDDTKKVVLTVGSNGEIRRRKETDHRGREVLTNQTRLLVDPKTDQNHPEGKSGQEDPPLFIDPEIYKMIDQNKIAEITTDFRMLEAFTWGLFHPEPGAEPGATEGATAVAELGATAGAEPEADTPQCPNDKDNYFIGDLRAREHQKNRKEQNIDKVLKSCFQISSGRDIKNVIRHYGKDERYGKNGKDGKDKSTFLMVDNWIFEVGSFDLYVRPVGNYHGIIEGNNRQDKIKVIGDRITHSGGESYESIKNGLLNSKNYHKFNDNRNREAELKNDYCYYIRTIFLGDQYNQHPNEDRLYFAWYFTASIIIESARNFRTFPITLMAMDMDQRFVENKPDFWFDDHSMARGGSWIDESRRGFSGSAAPCFNEMTEADRFKLSDVLNREHMVFKRWKESLGNVNKLEKMTEIADHYQVLNKLQKGTFETDCLNFMKTAESQKPESNCEGEPSGSASKGASEKPGINSAQKPAHTSKKTSMN